MMMRSNLSSRVVLVHVLFFSHWADRCMLTFASPSPPPPSSSPHVASGTLHHPWPEETGRDGPIGCCWMTWSLANAWTCDSNGNSHTRICSPQGRIATCPYTPAPWRRWPRWTFSSHSLVRMMGWTIFARSFGVSTPSRPWLFILSSRSCRRAERCSF